MGDLVKLLRHRLRMLAADAKAVANIVEEAFQGKSELDDEDLDLPTRQLFYDLQDAQVLRVARDEYEDEGKVLRAYRWSVDDRPLEPLVEKPVAENADFYATLSDHAWARQRN